MKAHTLPPRVKIYQTENSVNYNTIMGVNPKTKKNKLPTNILHLSPSNTSGVQVCLFAKNCKKVCLHWAGNPAYFSTKFKARINLTLSFNKDNDQFKISRMGGYRIDQKEAIRAGMRQQGYSGVVGRDSYITDVIYST